MSHPVLPLLEQLSAVAALLAHFTAMDALLVEVATMTTRKLLAAVRAEEALRTVVEVSVVAKAVWPRECLFAVLTLVRLEA